MLQQRLPTLGISVGSSGARPAAAVASKPPCVWKLLMSVMSVAMSFLKAMRGTYPEGGATMVSLRGEPRWGPDTPILAAQTRGCWLPRWIHRAWVWDRMVRVEVTMENVSKIASEVSDDPQNCMAYVIKNTCYCSRSQLYLANLQRCHADQFL